MQLRQDPCIDTLKFFSVCDGSFFYVHVTTVGYFMLQMCLLSSENLLSSFDGQPLLRAKYLKTLFYREIARDATVICSYMRVTCESRTA